MPPFVKQYGYYRCGTNYTMRVLSENFDCHVLISELGCKHTAFKSDWRGWFVQARKKGKKIPEGLQDAVAADNIPCIVTLKDPYAWANSFLLYAAKLQRHSAHFQPSKLHEHARIFSRNYKRWVKMQDAVIAVRYEDFLSDFEDTLSNIGAALQLTPRRDTPVQIAKRVDPHPHLRGRPFDPRFFLERRYLDETPKQHLDTITDNVDWDFFGQYGYRAIGRSVRDAFFVRRS